MPHDFVAALAIIGVVGMTAQWLAWRFNLPAIVLLGVGGLALGPLLGGLDPVATFGPYLHPAIGLAVGLILFEGGLRLDFRELRSAGGAVAGLTTIGPVVAGVGGSVAAHFILGLSWPVAAVLGGLLVVTGPTVIMPLLRAAHLRDRPAAVLKWEGIVNDPLGVMVAVLAYEIAVQPDASLDMAAVIIAKAAAVAIGGLVAGLSLAGAMKRGWLPHFLTSPVTLAAVIAVLAGGNAIQDEAGLLAVTVMGITVANRHRDGVAELKAFKDSIGIVMVSAIFVVLAASMPRDTIASIGLPALSFVAVMLLLVRPVSVVAATAASRLTLGEMLLTAWIAPRGVVAFATAGLLGEDLVAHGFADGARLAPVTFAMVAVSVIVHGFSLAPLAMRLGLRRKPAPLRPQESP